MTVKLTWSVVAATFLLGGCATTAKTSDLDEQKLALQRDLINILDKYSAKAIEAKEMTLSTQSALLQLDASDEDLYKITQDRIRFAPGLDKPISLKEHQSDIEEPLRLIASLTNYEIDFDSRPANTTVWVTLAAGQRSAQDWLYDMHAQAKGRINIDVYPNKDALDSVGQVTMGEKKNGKIFISFN